MEFLIRTLSVMLFVTWPISEPLEARGRIDFLNEKLPIPESERFNDAAYTASGVGLSYGVDKRLTYLAGNYGEATQRFEAAVGKFKYKSEIWVYLARAYFYEKQPEKARKALERASAVMPELDASLWRPLLDGLMGEIRQRANQLQVQVGYYSQSPDDYLALFRLYTFLQAYEDAKGVIKGADGMERQLGEQATMSSGSNRRTYRDKAREWRALAESMRSELRSAGVSVPPSTNVSLEADDADQTELIEAAQMLQLKVDYYNAGKDDYEKLFENYLELNQLELLEAKRQ